MNKIITAIAVLAVIAAGTAAALFQQLQPEEYPTVDAVVSEKLGGQKQILEKLGVGEDYIVILSHPDSEAYTFLDIRKSKNGYLLKEERVLGHNPHGLNATFKYSKKETATVSLLPDEQGVMRCSLMHMEG